jgi:hypothetical protein
MHGPAGRSLVLKCRDRLQPHVQRRLRGGAAMVLSNDELIPDSIAFFSFAGCSSGSDRHVRTIRAGERAGGISHQPPIAAGTSPAGSGTACASAESAVTRR